MSNNNENEKNLKDDSVESKLKLENTVGNLEDEIKSLEKVNSLLRDRIYNLEQENQDLKEKLENSMKEIETHPNIEINVHSLQKKIAKLEVENSKLKEELYAFKEEEFPEEPIGKVQELIQKRNTALENETLSVETWKVKETSQVEVPKGRVQELIQERNKSMGGKAITEEPPIEISEPIKEKKISHEKETTSSNIQIDQKVSVIETAEGRRRCPECGNSNQRLIREVTDKTKLISVYPKMYGTKFKCGECGAEWR